MLSIKKEKEKKSIRILTELSITDWHVYDIHLRIQYNHSLYHCVCVCACVGVCAWVRVRVCVYLGLWWWMKCSLWVLLLTISNLNHVGQHIYSQIISSLCALWGTQGSLLKLVRLLSVIAKVSRCDIRLLKHCSVWVCALLPPGSSATRQPPLSHSHTGARAHTHTHISMPKYTYLYNPSYTTFCKFWRQLSVLHSCHFLTSIS